MYVMTTMMDTQRSILIQVNSNIVGSQTNLKVEFYHQNGAIILDSALGSVINLIKNEEIITVKVKNLDTNCTSETTFKLIVNSLPIANSLNKITGCDDNNDGISEFFDTSNIEALSSRKPNWDGNNLF